MCPAPISYSTDYNTLSQQVCDQKNSYHHSIPLIPPRIATHECNSHTLLYQHIFAISQLVAKLNIVLLKKIKVLEFPRAVCYNP